MGWIRHKLLWDGNGTDKYVPWTTLSLAMLSIETFCLCPLDLEDAIKQWFSTLHGLWPPSNDSQHLWSPAHQ